MSVKPLTVPVKTLSASIISTSGSFSLNNITGWDGNDLVAANFGTQAFGAFLSADRTMMELFSFDPSTIANTSITFISRGLDFGGLQTNVPANNLDWTANETYVLLGTDTPQFLLNLASKTNDNEFTGVNTFDITPSAGTDPVNPNDLARLSYIQSLILGTLTTIDLIVPGTAGVTITQGQSIYLDTGTDTWKLTDGTNAATVNNVLLGIAQGAGTSGNAIANGVLLQGVDTHQTGQTGGLTYYASNTPGAISTTPGTNKVALGIAETATKLYFSPRFNQQLTQNQIDALAGDLGSPSSTNKFATQLGMQNRAETTATTTGSSTNTLGTFTVTIANPAVFTLTSHGLAAGDVIQLTTTGALPTGLSLATNYYVIASGLTTNTFEVSATPGGSAVATTGTQSGTHTAARPINTYKAAFTPSPTAIVSGQEFELIANFTNTGAAGVNIANLGTYNIVKLGSQTLLAGDIVSGLAFKVKFDGTNFQMLSPAASGVISGYVGAIQTNSSTTNQNIDVVFSCGFQPKVITLYYMLDGQQNSGGVLYYGGRAFYDGTGTLIGNDADYTGSSSATVAITRGTKSLTTTLPGVPSSTGGVNVNTNLSVPSITSTSFTVRTAYTNVSGGATGHCQFIAIAS